MKYLKLPISNKYEEATAKASELDEEQLFNLFKEADAETLNLLTGFVNDTYEGKHGSGQLCMVDLDNGGVSLKRVINITENLEDTNLKNPNFFLHHVNENSILTKEKILTWPITGWHLQPFRFIEVKMELTSITEVESLITSFIESKDSYWHVKNNRTYNTESGMHIDDHRRTQGLKPGDKFHRLSFQYCTESQRLFVSVYSIYLPTERFATIIEHDLSYGSMGLLEAGIDKSEPNITSNSETCSLWGTSTDLEWHGNLTQASKQEVRFLKKQGFHVSSSKKTQVHKKIGDLTVTEEATEDSRKKIEGILKKNGLNPESYFPTRPWIMVTAMKELGMLR